MSVARSVWDTWLIARFEVLRAVRTWRALALLLIYLIANVGGAYLFIESLSLMEDQIAAQLGVPTTRWPGALVEEVRRSEELMRMLEVLVGDEGTARQLLHEPLLAVYQLWQGFVFIPFLAATAAAEALALDVRTRAIRFEAMRTGRAELAAGRFVGQLFLSVAATLVALVGVWGLGMALMVQQDPVELASGLLRLGSRAIIFAVPFAGLGIAASALTSSPAWARVMALACVAMSWVVYGLLLGLEHPPFPQLADVFLPLLPQSWLGGLWRPGGDLLLSTAVCTALGLAVIGVGLVRFSPEGSVSDALCFDGVVKRYGRKGPRALDGMSFRIPAGSLSGFVGPNGAGKTTAFSVVSGFLPPDGGTIDILGLGPFNPWAMKGRLGVLPQDAELPDRHTPLELLGHLGRLQGLGADEAAAQARMRVQQVRLGDRSSSRIDTLSHGMRRRVAVASALLGRPDLVLLDEPTSGLDPVQARGLREVLTELSGEQTVVVSSHNLLELEQICDWVVMVDAGRCVRQGTVDELTGQSERIAWTVGPGEVPVQALRDALGCEVQLVGDVLVVQPTVGADLDRMSVVVMGALAAAGVGLRGIRRGVSLEDRFVDDAGDGR